MSETFELRIDSIAVGGDGVGRHNGMVVFVPRTAPGDVALVEAETHGRLMRGRVLEMRTPSPIRETPECEHYVADACGGCQLQHLGYQQQLAAKSEIIRDSLTRIGRLAVDAPIVEPSDKPWRYRRKLTFSVRRKGGTVNAGLHRLGEPDSVFDVRDCRIADEKVMGWMKAIVTRAELLPRAAELRVAVRLMPEGFALVIEGGERWDNKPLIEQIPEIVEIYWKPDRKGWHRFFTSRAARAGASFLQVNEGVAGKLVAHVASVADTGPHETAIDAYAGTGDIAVALLGLGARVTAIEIDRDAAALCRSRLTEDSNVVAASVEHALRSELPAELVVVNPPRAGLAPVVADALQAAAGPVKRLIYVSCDPGTLARDLKRMGNYRLLSVRGFDMFPQTAHVETVVSLEAA